MSQRCLLVYTKPSEPGRVKTRLIGAPETGALSATQAAELHRAFLADLLAELAGGRYRLELAWALEAGEEPPDGHHPGAGLPWRRQEGADLGERLYHGLAAAARHHLYVAAVGSDHPHLSAARVERAFALLEAGTDAVFGPAEDGGYYLVALSAKILAPALFAEIPWSSAETLAATLARCQELGLKVELLEPSPDVDTPADLGRLVSVLGQGEACCPETRRLLASWGRLSTPSEP